MAATCRLNLPTSCVKYTLFVLNTLWTVLGFVVICFGVLGWGAMPSQYSIGIIVMGGVILAISFLGCFGIFRESTRLLWIYVLLLFLLLFPILAYSYFTKLDVFTNYALDGVDELWTKELTQPGTMDNLQRTYECCGRIEPQDYLKIGRHPPSSCCKQSNCINPLNLHLTGCLKKVEEAFSDEAKITLYYQWGLVVFDFALLWFGCLLAIHFTNRNRRESY